MFCLKLCFGPGKSGFVKASSLQRRSYSVPCLWRERTKKRIFWQEGARQNTRSRAFFWAGGSENAENIKNHDISRYFAQEGRHLKQADQAVSEISRVFGYSFQDGLKR